MVSPAGPSGAASDKPAVATESAMAAPEPVVEAQLATVPPARRSVAELQEVLLANPVAGPPLGLVGQQPLLCTSYGRRCVLSNNAPDNNMLTHDWYWLHNGRLSYSIFTCLSALHVPMAGV